MTSQKVPSASVFEPSFWSYSRFSPQPAANARRRRPPRRPGTRPTSTTSVRRRSRSAAACGRVRCASGRVVAVTFLLDGRPLGSDTAQPYALDVDPAFLPKGRHQLRVVAVDSLGRRRSTAPTAVEISGSRGHVLTATPREGLRRALGALRRGNVTVQLGPGRYRLSEVTRQRRASGRIGPRDRDQRAAGRACWALLVAKGRNIRISDLTLDGGGGFAATTRAASRSPSSTARERAAPAAPDRPRPHRRRQRLGRVLERLDPGLADRGRRDGRGGSWRSDQRVA